MKTIKNLFFLLLLAVAFSSCEKESINAEDSLETTSTVDELITKDQDDQSKVSATFCGKFRALHNGHAVNRKLCCQSSLGKTGRQHVRAIRDWWQSVPYAKRTTKLYNSIWQFRRTFRKNGVNAKVCWQSRV